MVANYALIWILLLQLLAVEEIEDVECLIVVILALFVGLGGIVPRYPHSTLDQNDHVDFGEID